jgi:WD40 repeat protein
VVLVVTGFDLKTGKRLGEVEDNSANGALFVAAGSEATAVVSSGPARLRLFDYEDGRGGDEIETVARGEPGGAVVFSPDGKRFAYGVAADERDTFGVRVYAWPSCKVLHTFTGHRAPVTALTFSPDGKTLASGSHDATVLLWDLTTLDKK